jgi:trehalose 6-phosphate synthase/phosphatase
MERTHKIGFKYGYSKTKTLKLEKLNMTLKDPHHLSVNTESTESDTNFEHLSSPLEVKSPAEFKPNKNGRILIVSNRAPVSIHVPGSPSTMSESPSFASYFSSSPFRSRNASIVPTVSAEAWEYKTSSGGLVSAMEEISIPGRDRLWIGWPGVEVENPRDREITTSRLESMGVVPVFLPKAVEQMFYSGFSNTILWPLFHYMEPCIDVYQDADEWYGAYREANKIFAKAVLAIYRPGDLVWVHDYHLLLLPQLLRLHSRDMHIGFFFHTPFPSSEVYRALPWREELLHGVLSANVVGFQAPDYERHFHSACLRLLGVDLTAAATSTRTCVVPIGINPAKFEKALRDTEVQQQIKEFKHTFKGKRVVLGVDRLDHTKGLPHRLYAIDRFLAYDPKVVDKVAFVQIAVPTRAGTASYAELSAEVHELVGRINGSYGTLTDAPLHFLDKCVDLVTLVALYAIADVCFISSTRDGMNLVAFEYIASQDENKQRPGALILSEFTGAAQSLGAGAIRVNPWDVQESAAALRFALNMTDSQRVELWGYAIRHVRAHTSQQWAQDFLKKLTKHRPMSITSELLNPVESARSFDACNTHRLLVLGLLGTLTQSKVRTSARFRLFAKAHRRVIELCDRLARDPRTTVVVLTSRSQQLCDQIIGETQVWLAAENGCFLRRGGREQPWESFYVEAEREAREWQGKVVKLLQYYVERTPRSYLEMDRTHVSWYYHDSGDFGRAQALLMRAELDDARLGAVQVVDTGLRVSVRPTAISKGLTVRRLLDDPALQRARGIVQWIGVVGVYVVGDEDLFRLDSAASTPAPSSSSNNNELRPLVFRSSISSISNSSSNSDSGRLAAETRAQTTPYTSKHFLHPSNTHRFTPPPLTPLEERDEQCVARSNVTPCQNTLEEDERSRVGVGHASMSRVVVTATVGQEPASRAHKYISDTRGVEELLLQLCATLAPDAPDRNLSQDTYKDALKVDSVDRHPSIDIHRLSRRSYTTPTARVNRSVSSPMVNITENGRMAGNP